jgi:hypothetical protein
MQLLKHSSIKTAPKFLKCTSAYQVTPRISPRMAKPQLNTPHKVQNPQPGIFTLRVYARIIPSDFISRKEVQKGVKRTQNWPSAKATRIGN